ncbi:MAG: hypothetical protein OD815_000973 [Candidatus Alkanophagales archaeon MCA70_species_2]|nr:hypothetical protein [Candidatus Alkanophaga liquidiphilum]
MNHLTSCSRSSLSAKRKRTSALGAENSPKLIFHLICRNIYKLIHAHCFCSPMTRCLLPSLTQGASTVKLARLGVHSELHALSSCTFGVVTNRIPPLSLRSGLQENMCSEKYLNLTHPPPLAYPHAYAWGLASNRKIKMLRWGVFET